MVKQIFTVCLVALLAAAALTACADQSAANGSTAKEEPAGESMDNESAGSRETRPFPEGLEEIPEAYFSPAEKQGTLTELHYETYESEIYGQKSQKLQKRTIVYLPSGYDENEKYNIFYLMHGGWSNETTWLGAPEQPSGMKNVIDHAVADGQMQPMIIVCPTYNNLSGSDSGDYSLALMLTQNYHNELVNDLIPAVEGKYSTFAESTSEEDLKASRDYRGFGGFSMGSVATWRTFEYCLDYFRYFLPSSGSLTTDGSYMDEIVKNSGHSWDDFFIVAITGTEDFAASSFARQIEAMKEYTDSFRYSDNKEDGNLTYQIKEGYSHDMTASTEYAYNGLKWIWDSHGSQDSQGSRGSQTARTEGSDTAAGGNDSGTSSPYTAYTADTRIADVAGAPVFGEYGRLIFPVDEGYYSGNTLGQLRLTWYTEIDPEKTVEIANYMKSHAEAGDTIFYDIYTDEEKVADPEKEVRQEVA